jgi:hypothetical protein
MESNGYEENTMKISQFEGIKQENLGPQNTNQVPGRQTEMDDTIMDGRYDTNVPYVDPEVQNSSYGEPYNFGSATPRRPKATAINESPRSTLDDYRDRHVNKRSALPDFSLDSDDGPMDVYCLMADTEDERASTYDQIMKSKDSDKWFKAMKEEMNSIKAQGTWDLTELPKGMKAIGSRWIFKRKKNSEGAVERYKARFCAKGFTQVEGVDFTETFAPVAKMNSIRVLLSMATTYDLELQQADVDTAFLYGDVDTELYMKQPTGFIEPGKEHLVCKLKKCLYGTKQAARQWYLKIQSCMMKNGYKSCSADNCIFIKEAMGKISIIGIYVDDLIIACSSSDEVKSIIAFLKKSFSIKELGNLQYCLGVKVDRDRPNGQMFLSQKAYVERLVEKFGLTDCKPCYTPSSMEVLTKPEETWDLQYPYREAIGSLMYLMLCTRPDIANALGCVAKYCDNYDQSHWIAVKRIIRYLNTTKNYRLTYGIGKKNGLECYADASWGSDLDTRRSTTGYITKLDGNLISWKSQRQPTVATSSTEAEYMSLTAAVQEVIWLKRMLSNLKVYSKSKVVIFQDNQGAIALAKNPIFHQRTKHIDIKYHFVREQVESKEFELVYVPTTMMQADFMTKNLPRPKFEKDIFAIGLVEDRQGKVLKKSRI